MARTISQIAGEFGLPRGAAADPFAKQEEAVSKIVGKNISELQSRQTEAQSARGMARSTFSDAILAQERGDILGKVGASFASARTDEALRESDFERDIISEELGADRQSRFIKEGAEAETGLIGTRGEQERQTLAQQIIGEKEISQLVGEQEKETKLATIAAQAEAETALTGVRGAEERVTLAEKIAGESKLSSQQAAQDIERIGAAGEQSIEQIQAQAVENRALQEQEQEFIAQESLFGRKFSEEENLKQREFQEAFQASEHNFRATQDEINRSELKNQQVLDLVLSGNLSQDEVQEQISSLLGEGAVLSDDDEVFLQRVSAASGLSVEDYTSIRSAIGTAQGEKILGSHHATDSNNKKLYIDENGNQTTKATHNGKQIGRRRTGRKKDVPVYEKIPNEPLMEPNINSFIEDPVAQRAFALQMAELQSRTQVATAKEQSKGGKVLCTEYHSQGMIPDDIYEADSMYAESINPLVVTGYHFWGKPLVKVIQRNNIVKKLLFPLVNSWAYQMAYKMGATDKPNYTGKILEIIGVPICYAIGTLCFKRRVYNG